MNVPNDIEEEMEQPERQIENDDSEAHYKGVSGPIEHVHLDECNPSFANIGWTLGNDCPYRCSHCYSMSARRKGANLESWMVDRIVDQLQTIGIKTVNLGGNEPLFTHGLDTSKTLLPYIIRSLKEKGIVVGLTTSGITLIHLKKSHEEELQMLNDIDISYDSPFEDEHNANRGANLYKLAETALKVCGEIATERTIIMAAMTWNFTRRHLDALLELATKYNAHIRINTLKPVEQYHMEIAPDVKMYYDGFAYLMSHCEQIDLGDPLLATACSIEGSGCPCGRTSFRIHSITPDGKVPVSPCVYLHEYKTGDILRDDLSDIIYSENFRSFRRRVANPQYISGCDNCTYLRLCRGGCAARSYLYNLHLKHERSLFCKDPYCPKDHQSTMLSNIFPQNPSVSNDKTLVHRNYLCTWIGKPKFE